MGRPASTFVVPADTLSPEGEVLMSRSIAARQETDLARMAGARMAKYGDVLKAVGRIEAAEFNRAINDTLIAQTFQDIRRSKAYQGLPYLDADGQGRCVQDLDEFCRQFLGKSYHRCNELADNLHTLGPELYEQAQAVGFRNRDYRALKALPADDQAAVKAALEDGDKDTALTVLSQLVGRHQQAREVAERQCAAAKATEAETKANYEAATMILGERETEIRRLKGGDIPPPMLDAQMATWGPAAHYLVGELLKNLAQVAELVEGASQVDYPADSEGRSAWRKALALVDDALSPGLDQVAGLAATLQIRLEKGVSDKLYVTAAESDGRG